MNEHTAATQRPTLRISTSRRAPLLALHLGAPDTIEVPAWDAGAQRGSDLPARVEAFLHDHGVSPRELETVAVDVGPGSYTGLRVAVTFARFVAAFTAASLQGFTSLELLAVGAWQVADSEPAEGARLQVVLDARRGRVHTGIVELRSGCARLVGEPRAEEIASFRAEAPLLIEPALADSLAAREDAAEPPDLTMLTEPAAALLFDPRLQPRIADVQGIEPLYLMGTYADD